MLDTSTEISIRATRTLKLAFTRLYSIREHIDAFLGIFNKMATEDEKSSDSSNNNKIIGLNGLMAIIETTNIYGDVNPSIVDSLGILTDASQNDQRVQLFLSDFWRKYEKTLTTSSALSLSPLKQSLKDQLH